MGRTRIAQGVSPGKNRVVSASPERAAPHPDRSLSGAACASADAAATGAILISCVAPAGLHIASFRHFQGSRPGLSCFAPAGLADLMHSTV